MHKLSCFVILSFLTGCGTQSGPSQISVPPVVPIGTATPSPIIPTPINTPVPTPTPDIPQKHMMGFKKSWSGHGLVENGPYGVADRVQPIPEHFDWRALGFSIPVRNQGQCGGCWAFSTAMAVDYAMLIFQGRNEIISEQEIVDCDTDFWGCQGGDFAGAYILANGESLDSDYPYKAVSGSCKAKSKPRIAPLSSWSNLGTANAAPTTEELQLALMEFGPLSVSVAANSAWDSYSGGVMTSCSSTQIDHMVTLVGWDGKGNWIIQNQWGSDWGDNGFILMPYGCDLIANDAAYVVTK